MSKLTFPAVAAPYRGFADKFRNWIRETATFVQNSPASRDDIAAQAKAFFTPADMGGIATPPATSAIVASGQELTGVAPSGSYATKVTFTVVGGAITAIVLS